MKKIIMQFLSSLYALGLLVAQATYRYFPFRIKRVGARVISVGNITWGGTGKTPLTAKLARDLAYYGKKVAVLIRGYGDDEVQELRRKLPNVPVLVGRDRVKTAREAIQKHGAEFLILDDAFQHWRIHRDLDIVNINATEPFGPGGLLPRGSLREPVDNLRRAHVFILSKSNIGSRNLASIRQKLLALKPDCVIFEAVHKPMRFIDVTRNRTVTLGELRNRKVAVISGIGDPQSFEKTVETIGAEIVFAARFDDHHRYTRKELSDFFAECRKSGAREVITTEKDMIRLEGLLKSFRSDEIPFNVLYLEIEFQVNDEEDLLRRCLNS